MSISVHSMKTIQRHLIVAPLVIASFCMEHLSAASTVVDWLRLAPGATPGAFSLNDDDGGAAVSASLSIAPGGGFSFPGYPSSGELAAANWDSPPSFEDSLTGTPQVSLFNIRVVPQSGPANYRIDMTVPANTELIFAIGGIFADSTGATDSIIASAMTDSVAGVFTLVEMIGWSNGVKVNRQPLVWSESLSTLSTSSSSNGESGYAFLRLAPLSGANPRVSFSVPQGLGTGVGDEISIGVGFPIPEPSFPVLLLSTALLGSLRRRR
jgi:hypothetical protein